MPTARDVARSDYTRVWLIEDRAGPAHVPAYQGLWKAASLTWPQGDTTDVRIPDPDEYGKFLLADTIPGEPDNPGLTITGRYIYDVSELLAIIRRGCPVDLQVHIGRCRDPQDFNGGWEKILALEAARPTDYSIADLGALEPGERSVVNEEVPFQGTDMYEILPITFAEQAASEVVQEVVDIEVCDSITCGECGLPSDGCQVILALTLTAGGSPGLPAEVVYTQNGGTTWADTLIDTLAANEDPDDMSCVGTNLVVVSEDSISLHHAPIADILAGTEAWTEMATGFVGAGAPRCIFSLSPRHTWIGGIGGYLYFTADPTSSVTVQDAGIATIQDYNDIHGYDILNVVAVGNSNAVSLTRNGGETWAAVTGPVPGANLLTVWMKTTDEWWVGASDGNLYYTRDAGVNWTVKAFPGSGAGNVYCIRFSTDTVGWLAHATADPAGRILRSVDGGYSWYVAPEGNTTIPANDYIGKMAVCVENPNVVYGGGLAENATDGIIVKGS